MSGKNHFHPDNEDLAFVTRWNTLLSALLVDAPIKLIGRQIVEYGLTDGESIYPGNERLARQTCMSARQVQEAWHFLRASGMAVRENRSTWTGARRLADLYSLHIPPAWHRWPVLGPNGGRFTCQQCGKLFNPQAANTWLTEERPDCETRVPKIANRAEGLRELRWHLDRALFCPPPQKSRRVYIPSCSDLWHEANGRWKPSDATPWELLRKARNDEWDTW